MSENIGSKRFTFGDCGIDTVLHGDPGKSVCDGSLGFGAIALIRCEIRGRVNARSLQDGGSRTCR